MQNWLPWGGIKQFFEVRPPHQCATLPVDLDLGIMKHLDRITVKNQSPPPVIEIDPVSKSAYVRFKTGVKVARTQSVAGRGRQFTSAIDFDDKNEVVGVELVGVREFSIRGITRLLPKESPRTDFNRARFVPAHCADLVEA
jgi:hypothetical protein